MGATTRRATGTLGWGEALDRSTPCADGDLARRAGELAGRVAARTDGTAELAVAGMELAAVTRLREAASGAGAAPRGDRAPWGWLDGLAGRPDAELAARAMKISRRLAEPGVPLAEALRLRLERDGIRELLAARRR